MKTNRVKFLAIVMTLIMALTPLTMTACSVDNNSTDNYTKYISVSNERITQEFNGIEKQSCYSANIINKTDKRIQVTLLLKKYSLSGDYIDNLPGQYEFSPKESKLIKRFIPPFMGSVAAEWIVKVIE